MMNIKTITAVVSTDFRTWLEQHHQSERKVAVILYKRRTGKSAPTHRELMEEAICFGWIDTTIKRLDDQRYIRHFTKRNEKSKWSKNTLGYARDLIKRGKMTSEGLKYYKLGLQKPTHDQGIPQNPTIPKELRHALEQSNEYDHFVMFPPSTKKMLYRWILQAKTSETRTKRIAKVVEMAKEGKKKLI